MQSEYSGDDFTILGFSVDGKDDVNAYAKEMKSNYPVTHGEDAARKVAAIYGDPDGALHLKVSTRRIFQFGVS